MDEWRVGIGAVLSKYENNHISNSNTSFWSDEFSILWVEACCDLVILLCFEMASRCDDTVPQRNVRNDGL
jgi:hypothetical protein